jgi:hypothetical protein
MLVRSALAPVSYDGVGACGVGGECQQSEVPWLNWSVHEPWVGWFEPERHRCCGHHRCCHCCHCCHRHRRRHRYRCHCHCHCRPHAYNGWLGHLGQPGYGFVPAFKTHRLLTFHLPITARQLSPHCAPQQIGPLVIVVICWIYFHHLQHRTTLNALGNDGVALLERDCDGRVDTHLLFRKG